MNKLAKYGVLGSLGALGALGIIARRTSGPPKGPPPPRGGEGAPAGPTYRTAIEDIEPSQWVRFSTLPGKLVMLHPRTKNAEDKKAGVVFARTDWNGAAALAKALGGRMPTRAELDAMARADEGIIVAHCGLTSSDEAVRQMATREMAAKHDACMAKKFPGGVLPNGQTVLMNKTWVGGDPYWVKGGRSVSSDTPGAVPGAEEWGFWSRDGDPKSLVQKDRGAHDKNHVDYSMVPMVIKDVAQADA